MKYLERKKRIILNLANSPVLPPEFQEVEYIQSTGTQHIDTGYKINENFKYKIEFAITDTRVATNIYPCLIGAIGAANGSDGKNYAVGYTPSTNLVMNRLPYTSGQIITVERDVNKLVANGTNYQLSYSWVSEPPRSVYIFKHSYLESPGTNNDRGAKAKIYYAQIYDGDELKRDLIPCYAKTAVTDANGNTCNAGTIGMYDTVERKFDKNGGTGTFTKGNDVN